MRDGAWAMPWAMARGTGGVQGYRGTEPCGTLGSVLFPHFRTGRFQVPSGSRRPQAPGSHGHPPPLCYYIVVRAGVARCGEAVRGTCRGTGVDWKRQALQGAIHPLGWTAHPLCGERVLVRTHHFSAFP